MITGNLQIKNDKYYAVLNLKVNGKRKPKWIALGMPVRGNKRNAEAELMRLLNNYELEAVAAANWTQADVLLADYLQSWLKMVKPTIATSTHQSYKNMIDGRMDRHFRALGVSLGDLTPTQIQDFYQIILDEGYTPNTVIHYHAVLRRALQNAVKKDIIARNPADRIDKAGYSRKFYAEHETEILLHKAAKEDFSALHLEKLPTVKMLQAEYETLLGEKKKAYREYTEAKKEMQEVLTAKANVDRLLGSQKPAEKEPVRE